MDPQNGENPFLGEEISRTAYDLDREDYVMVQQLGNFEYLPHTFHSIPTHSFGMMTKRYDDQGNPLDIVQIHPFYKLKELACDSSIDVSDRMQSVRYMCFIPHIDHDAVCLEAAKAILFDESIDVYRRFHFFSNNEKFFKLTDLLVHQLHPYFFQRGLLLHYPFELLARSARYLVSFYDTMETIRQDALNWVIDIADDPHEQHRVRAEAADILLTCGEPDEVEFGQGIIDQLQGSNDLYQQEENVHSKGISESSRNIIRALQSDPGVRTTEALGTDVVYEWVLRYAQEEQDRHHIRDFFHRIQTDPTRFERLTLLDLLHLVIRKIVSLKPTLSPSEYQSIEALVSLRLFQEINDSVETCATGYMSRILNVLQGIVQEKEFALRIHPKDEIRSVIFARLNLYLRQSSTDDQQRILDSIQSADKTEVLEFIRTYDVREELWEEYQHLVAESDLEQWIQEAIDQYVGTPADAID